MSARVAEIKARIAAAAKRSGRAPDSVALLAVTKTFPAQKIQEAYDAGLRLFGENRVQEALGKIALLPTDCEWHLIGQLQTNKINKTLGLFKMIHSIDSLKLAKALSDRLGQDQEVLLEVNSSGEAAKSGFAPQALLDLFGTLQALPRLRIKGLMTVGPLSPDAQVQRRAFALTRGLFEKIKKAADKPAELSILSMGMSGDFEAAIEEGSTLVRVGRALFGERS